MTQAGGEPTTYGPTRGPAPPPGRKKIVGLESPHRRPASKIVANGRSGAAATGRWVRTHQERERK
jgi:hypothetical protein